MIKRRFYKFEHGDRDDEPSDSSSSSSSSSSFSDPESQANGFGEEFESGGDGVSGAPELEENAEDCSTSSGYETEDSSANEVDIDSSGLPIVDEDDDSAGDELRIHGGNQLSDKLTSRFLDKQVDNEEENEPPTDFPPCVLKCKSVFKCRICPRLVCLNEESLRVHLKSKRHSRSEKLLNEGRLKAILNSDGELYNEDTSTKEDAEIAAVSKDKRKREKGGRQRQHRRKKKKMLIKKKVEQGSDLKTTAVKDSPAKKRRKEDK